MNIRLTPSWAFTTNHAAACYGMPVLVNRATGTAFGPEDLLKPYPSWPMMTGQEALERLRRIYNLGHPDRPLDGWPIHAPHRG